MIATRSTLIPVDRVRHAFHHACPGFVHDAQVILRSRVVLLGGLPVPIYGFFMITGNTIADSVEISQLVLGNGIALLCGFFIPINRHWLVLRHTLTCHIEVGQATLSMTVAGLSRLTVV